MGSDLGAMVLAAGLGERMRPLTLTCPKPLLAVGGRTMLDRALDRLQAHGIEEAVVNVHYLGEMIERHLAHRTVPHIRISREAERLETGGGVVRALPLLGARPFAVVNADTVWLDGPKPALARLEAAFDPARMDALLLLHPMARAGSFEGKGDYFMDPAGRLTRRRDPMMAPYVFAGLQITAPRLFADAPEGAFSLRVLWDRAQEAGRLYGLVHDGAWFHIGTPAALAEADPLLAARNARWLEP